MKASFIVGGRIIYCELQYPHQPSPISISLPGGAQHGQQSPFARYDVLIIMPLEGPLLLPVTFAVFTDTMRYVVRMENPKDNYLYGTLLEKSPRSTGLSTE